MSTKNSHALHYLGVVSFGMFLLGFVYQMLLAGRGVFGAIFMGLIFAGVVAAIIYLFLMTTKGRDWSRVAAQKIEEKAVEVKTKVEEARASQSEAAPEVEAAPEPAPVSEPEPVAAPVEAVAAAEPGKPAVLDAPEGGAADDLKKIKGVGPKLEGVLNGMGFYHYHQIAAWGEAELAWVDENLTGFKGRASRDNWVQQAKDLAG